VSLICRGRVGSSKEAGMTSAYVVANVQFVRPDKAQEYGRAVPSTIERFGGRYLARGGTAEVAEGHWQLRYVTIMEFPSLQLAKQWYESEDYGRLRSIRLEHAQSDIAFVEGLAIEPAHGA
jgi:uncharacterized protein (DUF1330 family)